MVRSKKQRAKALEKGIKRIDENILLHKEKLKKFIKESDDVGADYARKEIKSFRKEKAKKEEQCDKLKK